MNSWLVQQGLYQRSHLPRADDCLLIKGPIKTRDCQTDCSSREEEGSGDWILPLLFAEGPVREKFLENTVLKGLLLKNSGTQCG